MSDICIRNRAPVARPEGNKVVLLTGNSMLGNYSRLTRFPAPPTVLQNVYEIDATDGQCYQTDGGPILSYESGYYPICWDGTPRESIMPYMAHLAVAAGHAPSISLINETYGGTDCVDWYPHAASPHWEHLKATLARLAALGIVPDMHIHYLGCWDALKGYTAIGTRGITNIFIKRCKELMPDTKMKIGKRTYFAGIDPAAQAAVWSGVYQAIEDNQLPGWDVSCGPDDDICLPDVAESVHYIDNSRYYVCQQWTPHFAGI